MSTARPALAAALLVFLPLAGCGGGGGSSSSSSTTASGDRPGTWERAGLLTQPRGGHTATVFPDGRVLVTGGGAANDDQPYKTAELYDPASGSWKPTGDMVSARSGHTATLLNDGKVLVTGGLRQATAELYDPATGTWAEVPPMGVARSSHTATLLGDGRVLIAGGFPSADTPATNSAELFDPATRTWAATGAMAGGRGYHSATALPSGRVLVAAGNEASSTRQVDTGTTTTSILGRSRSSGGGEVATAELYDPATGSWTATGPLAEARSLHAAAVLADGRVVVVGGINPSGQLASTEVYDVGPGSWTASGALATPRANHTATALPDGRVLVAGGVSGVAGSILGSTLPSVVLFDVGAGKWTPAKDMESPRSAHTASALPSGKILVVGGLTESGPVAPAEAFTVDRS